MRRLTDAAVETSQVQAERRQLTVMFCDLVGSTNLAHRLDPEELRELVRAYQGACAQVIARHDGHIAQYLGDGLLVYFGYPKAHEDDAERAARAGLEIVKAIREFPGAIQPAERRGLAVRVGIHTGLVVVGEIGSGGAHEPLALGETPNIASRVQALAEPNAVLVSGATYRLIRQLFICQTLGVQSLKGVSQPVDVFRVLEESEAQSRLEIASLSGLTPLVGREQEVGLLRECWARAKKGMGQAVLLGGEPGIGKSRLVKTLKDHAAEESHDLSELRCSPYYQNTALYPIIDLLQRTLQFKRDEAPTEKLRKLEAMFEECRLPLPEVVPLFASLLSLPVSERYPSLNLSPQAQKHKTLEALVGLRLAIAERQPVLYIVEDLHWADPSTLEWLGLLLDEVPTSRILVLLTFRREFRPPWPMPLTQITLSRLTRDDAERMVGRLTGGKALPNEVLQQIVAKTDGVPLFVEELTMMVRESGLLQEQEDRFELKGPLPPLAIPATLQDSLMARLDRLATVKEVAQLGATIGREFSYELLQALAIFDDATLQHGLAGLVDGELLYQRGRPPQAAYLFKHALIQEAAYQSLLKSKRQQYHQRIAQVLAERFPETADTRPELVAHHYTEAGLKQQATAYWQRAGQRAVERSANLEAVAHLTTGLDVLQTLPDTPERARQELMLQMTLGPALIATKGHAAPEVGDTYLRAQTLCQQVGDPSLLFRVLRGLWLVYHQRGELERSRELGAQCLRLAQSEQDPALILEAHRALGITAFYFGEFEPARAHFAQGTAIYDPQQHHSHAFLYGLDPGVVFGMFAAWSLWMLGYPNQAMQRIHEALTLAGKLAHPLSLAQTLNFAAWLHHLRREGRAAQERAEAAIALSTEQRFPLWLTWGTILRGWALTTQGAVEEGITQMRQGLTAHQATGAELLRPSFLGLLAEAYGNAGKIEEGMSVLVDAFAKVNRNRERWWEAELYRLKGELLAAPAQDDRMAAEACFRRAIDIARRQGAKSLELRATVSLSRLFQRQGKNESARQTLVETYRWFSEGFDTADLQSAKLLVDELR